MLSICLCSWNDLEYLKILYRGIKRNTKVPHEIIVHDNGSTDGTEEWLKHHGIRYTRSEKNEGVGAVNYAVADANYPYIVDINADMYPLPGWDLEILKQIQKFKKDKIEKFIISGCLIEPFGNNPEYTIVNGFGYDAKTFREENLLKFFLEDGKKYQKPDTIQYGHPIVVPTSLWREFGGVDLRYQYGIATDHDISASAYRAGCRHFVRLGKCRVWHFVSATVRKLPADRSDGQKTFHDKWGITVNQFRERLGVNKPYTVVQDGIFE